MMTPLKYQRKGIYLKIFSSWRYYLLCYCLSNLPDPVLVVSVGAPSDLPILCESASAAVCDESFTVPAWSALPVIIGESAASLGLLLLWHAAIPAQRHTPKISFFMVVLVIY
jgi:hypothetical protein